MQKLGLYDNNEECDANNEFNELNEGLLCNREEPYNKMINHLFILIR